MEGYKQEYHKLQEMDDSHKKGTSPIEECVLMHWHKNVITYTYALFCKRLDTHFSIMHVTK